MSWRGLLHGFYARLARSRAAVRVVRRLRNQCRTIVGYHVTGLAGSIDAEANGEALLARTLAPGVARWVDVGANVGDWAAMLDEATGGRGEGLLIEPSTSALAALAARFGGNPRLRVLAAAAADPQSPPALTFYEEPGAGQTSTMVPTMQMNGAVPRTVPVVTIDAELARLGWDGADLLKIDAEGFDLHVLRGAAGLLARQAIGVVQFEYNAGWLDAGSTLWGALRLAGDAGYACYLLTAEGLMPFAYADVEEFYTYANVVAVSPAWAPRVAGLVRPPLVI